MLELQGFAPELKASDGRGFVHEVTVVLKQ